jgi:hypothetical protein
MVVAANVNAFRMRYPSLPAVRAAGPFAGSLSNTGERLIVFAATGEIIAYFTYRVVEPWPVDADGLGYSLVLNNAAPNLTTAYYEMGQNWRPSATTGGLPGQTKAAAFTGSLSGDTDGDGVPDLLEYSTGSSFADPVARSLPVARLAPFTLDGSAQNCLVFEFRRNLLADGVSMAPELTEDLATWSSAASAVTYVGTHHNGDGTATVTYRSTLPVARDGEMMFMRLRATR